MLGWFPKSTVVGEEREEGEERGEMAAFCAHQPEWHRWARRIGTAYWLIGYSDIHRSAASLSGSGTTRRWPERPANACTAIALHRILTTLYRQLHALSAPYVTHCLPVEYYRYCTVDR